MTEYSEAWKRWIESDTGHRALLRQLSSGCGMAYALNRVRAVFDAGWSAALRGPNIPEATPNNNSEHWVLVPRKAWDLAQDLIREVVFCHSDKRSHDYNDCDETKCMWCEEAEQVLAAAPRAEQKEESK